MRIHEVRCKGNLLGLLLTSKEKLISDININDILGCSDHVAMGIQDPEKINEGQNQHSSLISEQILTCSGICLAGGCPEEQKETRKAD